MQSNDVDKLINKIASLEIDNQELKKEVKELKHIIKLEKAHRRKPRQSSRYTTSTTFVDEEYERARRGIFLDRYDRELEQGDEVYILTNGAHTSRSRRGTVTGFDNHRNRVYIRDEVGTTQERAPKNLRLESRISK